MASVIRPSVLRQSCLAASASKRAFTTKTTSALTKSIAARPAVKSAFAQQGVRVAAFHASGKQQILPPGAQNIQGTANEAAKFPAHDPTHGSYQWTFERLIAVGLIPLTVAPFVAGTLNPATDAILCAAILIHSHIGFEACITDYFPNRRVPKTRKTFDWMLKAATVGVGIGLYEFETNDVGVTEAIKRIWKA